MRLLFTKHIFARIRNSFVDNRMVDVYVRKGQSQSAIDLLYDMLKNGIKVKPAAFFGVISILIAENRVGEVFGIITQHASNFSTMNKSFWLSLVSVIVMVKRAVSFCVIFWSLLSI